MPQPNRAERLECVELAPAFESRGSLKAGASSWHSPAKRDFVACDKFQILYCKNSRNFAPSAPFRGSLAVVVPLARHWLGLRISEFFRISTFGLRICGGRSFCLGTGSPVRRLFRHIVQEFVEFLLGESLRGSSLGTLPSGDRC